MPSDVAFPAIRGVPFAAALDLITCADATGYVAGSVDKPNAAQVAAYAATYLGDEGSRDIHWRFHQVGYCDR